MIIKALKTFWPQGTPRGTVVTRDTIMNVDTEYGKYLVTAGLAARHEEKALPEPENKMLSGAPENKTVEPDKAGKVTVTKPAPGKPEVKA